MYIPKRYGEARLDRCPFCGRQATVTNVQKVPVCVEHRKNTLNNLKCSCGSFLDLRQGKFGAFFTCFKCGAISMSKALELNKIELPSKSEAPAKKFGRSVTEQVRSDDSRYFD